MTEQPQRTRTGNRPTAAPTRARRSQAQRSAATRAALADATIDVLVEHGWAAVTAIEVCNRAGVTRGAFHHHYTNLSELLAEALRTLYAQMTGPRHVEPATLCDLLDATWSAIDHPRFKAVLEAWLATSNHPELAAEIGPVVAEFATMTRPDRFAPSILTTDAHRDLYALARETMIGLALGRATNGGRPLGHEARVLERLRADATALDEANTTAPDQQ